MGCDCFRSKSSEDIIDSFWSKLKIRTTDISEITSLIAAKKGKVKKITDKKFISFIENISVDPKYHELSNKLFTDALNDSRKLDEGYFFISILFLAKSDLESFIQNFITIWKNQVHQDNSLSEQKDNKVTIKADCLKDAIGVYINMISKISVPYFADIFELGDKNDILTYYEKPFSKENQTKYIEQILFKNFDENEIDVHNFFNENLANLSNDTKIRNELMTIHIK